MIRGRTPVANVKREPNGRISRRREQQLELGRIVHTNFAVYFAACGELTKVGYSGNLAIRMTAVSNEQGDTTRIVGLVHVPSEATARVLEAKLHRNFKEAGLHEKGEWFRLSFRDVSKALASCRKIGLKTFGCEEAEMNIMPRSGLASAGAHEFLTVVNG